MPSGTRRRRAEGSRGGDQEDRRGLMVPGVDGFPDYLAGIVLETAINGGAEFIVTFNPPGQPGRCVGPRPNLLSTARITSALHQTVATVFVSRIVGCGYTTSSSMHGHGKTPPSAVCRGGCRTCSWPPPPRSSGRRAERPSRTLRAAPRWPSALLDRRSARRPLDPQVGTEGWCRRSNKGMGLRMPWRRRLRPAARRRRTPPPRAGPSGAGR